VSESNKRSKVPLFGAVVYLALVLLSVIPVFTGDDALDAIFLVVLTLPWSFFIAPVVNTINPSSSGSIMIGLAIALIGAAFNMVLLYLLTSRLVNKINRR
jgi:hypothetical protein